MGNETNNPAENQPRADGSSVVERLTRIWTDVLGRPPLTLEQSFFEAGGDPASALRFCDRIRVEFGAVVPPLAMYGSPTTVALAGAIAGRAPLRFSNALLLKPGSNMAPPVFLLHGIGGNVMEFFDLVQNVAWPHPMYGLQARGSDGLEPPLDSMEAMAEYHLEAVRRLQPHGPYLFCGYSLGGVVALEMARKLREYGEMIGLLAMIDGYPPPSLLPAAERSRLYLQRVQQRLHRAIGPAASRPPSPEQARAINEKICGPSISAVTEAAFRALQQYRPTPYSGKVRFFTPRIKTTFPKDPLVAWKDLLPGLTVETVAGTHDGMLHTSAATLAAALSGYIAEGLGTQTAGAPAKALARGAGS